MKLYQGKPIYNRIIFLFISIFVGLIGLDRIYLGDYKLGILKFATLGGVGIWYLLDLFRICLGEKLGTDNYWWSCQLNNTYNCQYETRVIYKALIVFAIITFIIIYFYGPSNKLLIKKDTEDNTYII